MSTTQLRESLKQRACEKIDSLKNDLVGISHDIHAHPEVRDRLLALAEGAREELGDRRLERVGSGVRPPGRVE